MAAFRSAGPECAFAAVADRLEPRADLADPDHALGLEAFDRGVGGLFDLKPSVARHRRLIGPWSASRRLFKYLNLRSRQQANPAHQLGTDRRKPSFKVDLPGKVSSSCGRAASAGGSAQTAGRDDHARPPRYAGHRYLPEVIGHAIWLHFRFLLSPCMVEKMRADPPDRRQPRDRPAVYRETRPAIHQRDRPQAAKATRGRGRDHHLRQEALLVAGCRIGQLRARHPGVEPARSARRQAPLAQAHEEASVTASRHDHRQAGELCRGEGGADAWGRAPPAQGPNNRADGHQATIPKWIASAGAVKRPRWPTTQEHAGLFELGL